MSAQTPYDGRLNKGKQPAVNPPSLANPGHSGPTTFFLKSESEMERSMNSRGRRTSCESKEASQEQGNNPTVSCSMADSSFGVQSLEETISESLYSDRTSTLSRTESRDAEQGAQDVPDSPDLLRWNSRKRKAGNPVHPSIRSAGNRILSSEQSSAQPSSVASPASFRSSESPFRSHLRRASYSSIHLGQPITPLRASPMPESALPSTPRSGSLRSFRLSDEEISVTSETHSHVIHSSSDDEEEDVPLDSDEQQREQVQPQLVMPSISMPARRPFTERGRNMGRLKIMVAGSSGSGKSTLISNMARILPDIVHTDPAVSREVELSRTQGSHGVHTDTKKFLETSASTKPLPFYWRERESSASVRRRKSFSDGMLERNLCFIEAPSVEDERTARLVLGQLDDLLDQSGHYEALNDSQLMDLFSGAGGIYVDAVLYLIKPDFEPLSTVERDFLRELDKRTVVIPVISHADSIDLPEQSSLRESIRGAFSSKTGWHHGSLEEAHPWYPLLNILAVSCAPTDDSEEVDASLLMSSDYQPPLRDSDLGLLVRSLFNPETMARVHYEATRKFIDWRKPDWWKSKLGFLPNTRPSPSPRSPSPLSPLPSLTSPSAEPSSQALARLNSLNNPSPSHQPFSQLRLAKWAEDLQRSLAKDRSRYTHIPHTPPSQSSPDSLPYTSDNEKALTRPGRGRLGGDLAVIDPSDPLGILSAVQSLHRRGWFALQMSAGVAVVWWIFRNWAEWTGWGGHNYGVVEAIAVQAPAREGWGWW